MNFANAVNITLSNITVQCSECGGPAQVLDGTFDFDIDGVATVLAAPRWTQAALQDLQSKLKDLRVVLGDAKATDVELDRAVSTATEELGERDALLVKQIVAGVRGQPRPLARRFLGGLSWALDRISSIGGAAAIGVATYKYRDEIARILEQAMGR